MGLPLSTKRAKACSAQGLSRSVAALKEVLACAPHHIQWPLLLHPMCALCATLLGDVHLYSFVMRNTPGSTG